jgi:hypothetical protein
VGAGDCTPRGWNRAPADTNTDDGDEEQRSNERYLAAVVDLVSSSGWIGLDWIHVYQCILEHCILQFTRDTRKVCVSCGSYSFAERLDQAQVRVYIYIYCLPSDSSGILCPLNC